MSHDNPRDVVPHVEPKDGSTGPRVLGHHRRSHWASSEPAARDVALRREPSLSENQANVDSRSGSGPKRKRRPVTETGRTRTQ